MSPPPSDERSPAPAAPLPPDLFPQPAAGRRVVLLAVHHVRVGDDNYRGGAEKYIRQVLAALLDAGAAVHVGYSGTSIYDDLLARNDSPRLTVERTDWLNDALSGDARLKLSTIRDRRRWLAARGADTVLAVQQAGGGAFGASLVAARTLGLRVVSSVRQLPEEPPPPSGKRWLGVIPSPELWRQRLIWRRRLPAWCCDAIIFNSRRVAERYARAYGWPRRRFRIIPNGEPTPARRHEADAPPRHLAAIGRVTAAKGADTVLEAFALVAGRHPEARLTYFGDGPLIPVLRARAAELNLGDRVVFAGYREDRASIYRDVDLCVQASRREALSNSVIEALARGIPCVVTAVGGLPEAVVHERNGLVVPPDRPEALAAALTRLLADPATYARFSRAAAALARERFELGRVMRATVATVLGRPRRSRA